MTIAQVAPVLVLPLKLAQLRVLVFLMHSQCVADLQLEVAECLMMLFQLLLHVELLLRFTQKLLRMINGLPSRNLTSFFTSRSRSKQLCASLNAAV